MENGKPSEGQSTRTAREVEGVSTCEYLDVSKIAWITDTHPNTVRGWIRSGSLPAVRLGERLVRVRRSDLDAFVSEYVAAGSSGWLSPELGR